MVKRTVAAAGLVVLALSVQGGQPGTIYYDITWTFPSSGLATEIDVAEAGQLRTALAWSVVDGDGTRDVFFSAESLQQPRRINTTTAGDQSAPAAAIAAEGHAVIAWQGPNVEGATTVFAQRLATDALNVGPEFQVNVHDVGQHQHPDVGMDAFGNFVVSWQRTHHGSSKILARRFATDGTPLGNEFDVAELAGSTVDHASIAVGAWGEFAIAWDACGTTGCAAFVRSYAADGTAVGEPQLVGGGSGASRDPVVAMDARGRFVVAWNGTLDGNSGVYARRFDVGGVEAGPAFWVCESQEQQRPSVAMDVSGDFVVASQASCGSSLHLYTTDGMNTVVPTSAALGDRIAMDADGDIVTAVGYNPASGAHFVVARVYSGPEEIDLALHLSAEESTVEPGEAVHYTISVTNQHPISAETGIPAVDSTIGVSRSASWSTLQGAASSSWEQGCFGYYQGNAVQCQFRDLAPGASASRWATAIASADAHVLSNSTEIYSPQADPTSSNNKSSRNVDIACLPGNTPGRVSVRSASASVVEGSPATFVLERTGGTCGAVAAWYTNDAWDVDYEPVGGTVTWAGGEGGTKTIAVATTQDNIDEPNQELSFRVYAAEGGLEYGSPISTTMTLVDDDSPPTVTISGLEQEITERSSPYATFTVTLSHGTEHYVQIPVTYGGTATWADFSTSPLYLPLQGTQRTWQISAIWDQRDEADETITLDFGAPTANAIMQPVHGVITIHDGDDPPGVLLRGTGFSGNEGASTTVRVELRRASSLTVTVPLQWSGAAQSGADFSMPASVTFQPGQTVQNVPLQLAVDGLDEDQEQATLTLGTPTNGIIDPQAAPYPLTIQDIDPPPTVSFVTRAQATREGAGSVVVEAELSAISGKQVRLPLTSGGTAGPSDYTLSANEIVISAGQRRGSIQVAIKDDAEIELNGEILTLSFGALTNAQAGNQTTHSITILDNDPIPLDLPR